MQNKVIKNLLIYNYGHICMLGGKITLLNPLTMHHIIRVADGGESTLENGSLASSLSHSGLHIVSEDDPKKKEMLIKYLQEIKVELLKGVNLKEEMDAINSYIENRVHEMGFVEFLTKDKRYVYKKGRYHWK